MSEDGKGLCVEQLVVQRGGAPVVRGVTLSAPAGEVTLLLGANGGGKTTLLEAISGVIPAAGGSVTMDGRNIVKLPRDARARLGLAHVEQGRSIFPDMTVEENLLAAGPTSGMAKAFELFPELDKRRTSKSALLSGGEQQMLVIARGLVKQPEVLLLDEMSLGLAPTIVKRLLPVVRQLADEGVGVLLVEQFALLALSIGNRACVMVRGEIAYEGPCDELQGDPDRLHELYLGATPAVAGKEN